MYMNIYIYIGRVVVKDRLNSSPSPLHSKRDLFPFFVSVLLRNVQKRMINRFSNFCDFLFLRYNRSKMGKIVSL